MESHGGYLSRLEGFGALDVIALAREAAIGGDRIAAENFYQHAEHYLRVANASREGNQQGTPRPSTPADVEMNPSETQRHVRPR